jgi:prepilin-type N-terminal cleavage/methylation domain-containing protein
MNNIFSQKGSASTATRQGGFTLIEILVVIGIIAVLALIVLIAINPARQFAQARNTQRTSNVESILNAIGQNMVDNKGVFTCAGVTIPTVAAPAFPITAANQPAAALDIKFGAGGTDLSCLTPTYIPALPTDPKGAPFQWTSATNYDTGYYVFQDSNGRITVFSPNVEAPLNQTNFIYITR